MRRRDLFKLPALAMLPWQAASQTPFSWCDEPDDFDDDWARHQIERSIDARRRFSCMSAERAPESLTARWVPGDGPDDAETVIGGDPRRPRWREYREGWQDPRVPDALRVAVPRNMDASQVADGHFVLSDGRSFSLSTRACGDLMQAILDVRSGYEDFAFGGRFLAVEGHACVWQDGRWRSRRLADPTERLV